MVTTFDPGRMIWNGYTGAAGWMFRQALEGVLGPAPRRRPDRRPRPTSTAGGRLEPVRVSARPGRAARWRAPSSLRPRLRRSTTEASSAARVDNSDIDHARA